MGGIQTSHLLQIKKINENIIFPMLLLLTSIAFMAVTLDRVTSISINITMNKKMRCVSYEVFLTVVKKNLPFPLSRGVAILRV